MMTTNKYPWHESISGWMQMVETGEQKTCEEQKKIVKIVRRRLEAGNVVIDEEKINKCIERSEKYFFKLHPFQRFFVAFVVGVYDERGFLLFDDFLFLAGRGTGKNGLVSSLLFNLPAVNKVKEYHIDIVATSEDQAKISFNEIFNVIKGSKKLDKKKFDAKKSVITHLETNSEIKYRTSNPNTKDGGRQGAVVFDEIHQYENEKIIDVFTSGLGKKKYPRRLFLTTDGYVRGGYLDDLKVIVNEIFNDELKNNVMLPFVFKLDKVEEVHDESNWVKAIPRLPYDPDLYRQVKKEYEFAKRSPSSMIEFLTKRMNIPTQDKFSCVAEWDDILATNQPMPDMRGWSCVGGIDFSDIRDFAAVGLLFKKGVKRYWIHHSFICHKSLKITNFKFDIDRAVKEGYVTIIDDDVIDPSYVAEWFFEKKSLYNVTSVNSDMFRYRALKDEFTKRGMELGCARSGSYSHNQIAPLIDLMFAKKNIVFGEDFMMRWYTNNVYVEFDKKGNKTYSKIEPKTRKTDGFSALFHALQIEPEEETEVHISRKKRNYRY